MQAKETLTGFKETKTKLELIIDRRKQSIDYTKDLDFPCVLNSLKRVNNVISFIEGI